MYFGVNIFFHTCKLEVRFQSIDSCSSSLGNILLFCWWSSPPLCSLFFVCGTLVCKWDFLDCSPNYFLFSSLFSVFFLSFLSFFLFLFFVFWPHCMAYMLVPWPGIKAGSPQWKHQILTIRPPGNTFVFLTCFLKLFLSFIFIFYFLQSF